MRDLLLHNWHLKLISLALAAVLWSAVARSSASEIGVSVPLEYLNIPHRTEVYGDSADRVEIRLRGPSSLLRGLAAQDVSLSIDMAKVAMGQEKILPLTPGLVRAPFGLEVVRVIPARVRFTIEPTAVKSVRVSATLNGVPGNGFEIEKVSASPDMVDVEGPASHVVQLEVVPTTALDVAGKRATFSETVDLDIMDPVVRAPKTASVQVQVFIRRNDGQ